MLPILNSRITSARHPIWQRLTTILLMAPFMLGIFGATPTHATPTTENVPNAVIWPNIRLQTIANGFNSPVDVVSPNDGTNRLFVLERGGRIYIIENGVRLADPFLNISSRVSTCSECGLLGLAFPPDFAENGYFFVNYTSNTNLIDPLPDDDDGINNSHTNDDTVIARFHVTANPNVADSANEEQILLINQPEANHNGGHILFGPDNRLYIGMGDGGGGDDAYNNAQDPDSLLGKILRIEVGETGLYTIPVDNPFVNTAGYRDEIWVMGVRNPWRYGFDRVTGDLYIADVGQSAFEEIDHVAAADIGNGGMNFGWPILEGNNCHKTNDPQNCEREDLIRPVAGYNHNLGDCSVTGGYVFDSPRPNQEPIYLYGDYCTGRVWGLQPDGNGWATNQLEDFPFQITSFGDDATGNVYLVSDAGTIYRIYDFVQLTNHLPSLAK